MAEATIVDMLSLVVIMGGIFAVFGSVLILVRRHLKRLAAQTGTKLDDVAFKLIEGPLLTFVVVIGVVGALSYWEARFPDTLPLWLTANLGGVGLAAGIMMAISVVVFILNETFTREIRKIAAGNPERETTFRLLRRLTLLLIYGAGSMAALTVVFPGLTGSLTTLLFGAGFLGIVIGLAAQKVIGNMLSGISVNVTQPVRVGDAVVIRGEFGFIEDMTLRHVMIRTWDNRRMIIPNAVLDDEVIMNYTIKDSKKLFPIVVYVPYDINIEQAAEIMINETQKHPDVLPELKPIFQVLDFEEGAIKLRLLFLAKDQGTAFGAACDIRRAVKNRFDKEGIRLSAPTRRLVIQQNEKPVELEDVTPRRK
jgi:small-conductance mechanosensitive channel